MLTPYTHGSYKEFDEQTLIELCNDGDQLAISTMYARYIDLINYKVYSYSANSQLELDDLKQEACFGFYNAITSFKEDHAANFKTYASTCISNVIINAINKHNTKKSKMLNQSISFEDVQQEPTDMNNPEQIYIQNETCSRIFDQVSTNLSEFEYNVIVQYLQGYDYNMIAKSLNSESKSVDNALQRARKKLKAVLAEL